MVTTALNINFTPGGAPLQLHISQYDVGLREYVFTPYSSPGTLDMSAANAVTLEATKPDGYAVINSCTYNSADHTISYVVSQQLGAVVGRVWSKLVIRDIDENVLGTAAIIWVVDPAGVQDDAIISDSDISSMQDFIAEYGSITAYKTALDACMAAVGGPSVASTVAQMTDTSKVYVYTGSETGYTYGDWYYWNGSAWVSGGVYNAAAVATDKTLKIADMAADAKTVGGVVNVIQSAYTVSDGVYIALSGNSVKSTASISIVVFPVKKKTYYKVKKATESTMRVAVGNRASLVNGDVVYNISVHDSASADPLYIYSGNYEYLYIQLWANSDPSGMRNIDAHISSLVISEDYQRYTAVLQEEVSNAYPTENISGALVNFTDGVSNIPVKEAVVNITPFQAGSGDPSPSNIRAISGWTGLTVTRRSKNLLRNMFGKNNSPYTSGGITFTWLDDGGIKVEGTATSDVNAFIDRNIYEGYTPLPTGTYQISGCPEGGSTSTYSLQVYKGSGSVYETGSGDTFTISGDDVSPTATAYTRIVIKKDTALTTPIIYYPMARRLGDTDTTFVKSNAEGVVHDWSATIGTVYGGTLNVTTGVLTVTMGIVDMGSIDWGYNAQNTFFALNKSDIGMKAVNTASLLCSVYKTNGTSTVGDKIIYQTVNAVRIKDTSYSTTTAFKEAVSGQTIAFELATPQTYQLSPSEITELLGENNIFANTGDVSVTYRADTTEYIRKLTGAEEDMIANANIASGAYFMVGNTLYYSTTAIAAGATIAPGTNCTLTTLAEALNTLNS